MEIIIKYNDQVIDIKNIISEFNEVEECFLLRDNYTEFEGSPNVQSKLISITRVFLAYKINENAFTSLKGNLRFDKASRKIEFYPFFKNDHNLNENENLNKYLYEIKIQKQNNSWENLDDNAERFPKIFKELQKEEYCQPVDSYEWENFIEPYEFYASLKTKLLTNDLFIIDNCEQGKITDVIKIKYSDNNYANYSSKTDEIISEYEDYRESFLLIKKNKLNSSQLSNDFLKHNSYKLMTLTRIVKKVDEEKARKKIEAINTKISKNSQKLSFYNTKRKIDKKEISKNINLLGWITDNQIDVDNFYTSDLIPKEEFITFDKFKLKNYLNQFIKNKIDNPTIEDLIAFLGKINNNNLILQNIKKELNNYHEKITFNTKNVVDADEEKLFENISLLNEINQNDFLNTNNEEYVILLNNIIKDFKIFKKEYEDNFNKYIFNLENNYKNQEKNLTYQIEQIQQELKSLSNKKKNKKEKLTKYDERNILKETNLNNELKLLHSKKETLKKEWNFLKREEIEKNKLTYNQKYLIWKNNNIINNRELLINRNNFNKIINRKEEKLNNFLSSIKELKIIHFEYQINMVFSIEKDSVNNKQNNQLHFTNIFTLNMGDYTLLKTIKNIITEIKRKTIRNDEVLAKIIRQKDLVQYDEDAINEDLILEQLPSFEYLDEYQKKAFKLAIDQSDPIAIIQGPPGTGKTTVITEIIKYYHTQNKHIVISSQTNVAIENVLEKLADEETAANSVVALWKTVSNKREFSENLIDEKWHKKIFENLKRDNNFIDISSKIEKDLASKLIIEDQKILNELNGKYEVIGATTTTSKFANKDPIDVLIIDEVSKCILPEILRYALNAKKIILVGDYKQLSPIFDLQDKRGFDFSEEDASRFDELREIIERGIFYELVEAARKKDRVVTLKTNYRSLPGVIDAYNVFYDKEERLEPKRKFDEFHDLFNFDDDSDYFSNDKNLYFFNIIGGHEKKSNTSRFNQQEIEAITFILDDLCKTLPNAKEKDIAIIFPYAAQIYHFQLYLKQKNLIKKYRQYFKDIKWDTVDSFQGSEANIVILSTVITELGGKTFLRDARRINVALSRAKDLLIIFGAENAIKSLNISSTGIDEKRYFSTILKAKNNPYFILKEIDFRRRGK